MVDDNELVIAMDVSELLAQKYSNRAERTAAAADEPEFVLTESEFDYQLRKAFADRERNVEKQVGKLVAEHMGEIESRIADAMAELPCELTSDDVEKLVASKIAELPYALTPTDLAGHLRTLVEEIAETFASRKQIKELRTKIAGLTLRLDALMHEQTKRQIIAADVERREAEVVDLMRRSVHRA